MSNVVEFQLSDRFENECDIEDIVALGELLCVMLVQPDAESALSCMQRVACATVDRAKALRERLLENKQ